MEYSPPFVLELPRIPSASPGELEAKYISKGIPVVLTDMISSWPAFQTWTLPYLKEKAGHTLVPIRGNRHHFRLLGTTSLSSYIDWLNGETTLAFLDNLRHAAPYISHNRGITPQLEAQLDFAPFAPPGYKIGRPAFWIGPPNAETPLHYDSIGIVFFAQIIGRKKVILFPKEQSPSMYESNYFDYTTCYSRVNLSDLDYRRFPRFASATPYVTVLNPGELLVFPRKMWHEFRTLDNSVSVTSHAGTPHDYSYRNPMLRRERTRQALHWFGLHARRQCSCHSMVKEGEWEACMRTVSNSMAVPPWIRSSPLLNGISSKISRTMLHDRSLAEILGWSREASA